MATPVNSPMVGKLISVDVKVGDQVKENDPVATIEAMKMYVKIYAPASGVVKEIKANPGDVVNPDTVILTLE
ncbi:MULTISPECIES: biotin/lipoyl-containing protein [Desulfofundulus]|uniref:Acetyl-CoA carboxylase biotin carboxyl carrier protein subunit n=1 Tax=Desulfofundulus salinus TaxID=2419843 RepID=A0A494WW32_9FIRM|nr:MULTISPECIES: biotin/lipoyl-containing protein [Desulfofundulus]NHM28601.1 acetyl-CoA carboxylase biotin carboxyl carrier protein subunit [Desulfofundulus sp. TPOSR]RKO67699.1 acetyl-CoA carboxylase biotin carboxyl carrier protein subunit [Desulfofundulus salinum]